MKELEQSKEAYDNIPIPEELSQRVQMEIGSANQKRSENKITDISSRGKKETNMKKMTYKWVAAAASLVVVFTLALNTSQAFANGVSNVPVIGMLAKVLTFVSYETETEDLHIKVEIPSVDMIAEDFTELEDSMNEEIYAICEKYVKEATERAAEYKEAFLSTGGTEEEWIDHNIAIKVDYEVLTQNEKYLSLKITGAENWTSAYAETLFYNVDLEAGKEITLEDVLGENWKSWATDCIKAQAADKEGYDVTNWAGVDENTKFYMNEAGHPVVVLEKYEIAAGFEGMLEFEITQ